ncbi:hypothetical protein [Ferroplasma sp.]|uniref:hypothetical protein n=1 Tax=Ferroplasma sp. TaxID=2591003 RepID=UPI00307E0377
MNFHPDKTLVIVFDAGWYSYYNNNSTVNQKANSLIRITGSLAVFLSDYFHCIHH